MPLPPLVIVADYKDGGHTLAAVLKARLTLTWKKAQSVIERRHVRVGGQIVADPAYRVKSGKRITIAHGAIEVAVPAKPKADAPKKLVRTPKVAVPSVAVVRKPPTSPFAPVIVYSDDAVVVIDKPAGLTTVRHDAEVAEGTSRFRPTTLADLLPDLLGTPGKPVYAVHRIDRDTSGLIVFARTKAAAASLTQQFRKHTTERRYVALVRGKAKPGRIQSVLVRDRGDGRRGSGATEAEEGRTAVTFVKVLEVLGGFSLVECRLETGRTHQVRIHLGEAGTPLCGETVYDRSLTGQKSPDTSSAKRPLLHAAKLGFAHPETNDRMVWEVQPPADFAGVLAGLRGSGAV